MAQDVPDRLRRPRRPKRGGRARHDRPVPREPVLTAAPVVEAAPVAATLTAAAVESPSSPKPKGPRPETVAYVHVPDGIACTACAAACPAKAITVLDFSQIDPNICEACNEGMPVCPTDCISMAPRAGYAQLEFAVKA